MPRLRESDLLFHFPNHWHARVYDRQPFYLRMSGMGVKGVDFIAYDPIGVGHVYLIEVKNYRTRQTADGKFTAKAVSPEVLAQTIAIKYEHTQRAIRAIQLHYSRKWWYKLTRNHWQKSKRYHSDLVFWTQVFQCLQKNETHTLLLWLEMDTISLDFEKVIAQVVQYELNQGVNFTIDQQIRRIVPEIYVEYTSS